MKKRTKQTEALIKATNKYLRVNGIKDKGDSVFGFVTNFLLSEGLYSGFNYFKVGVDGNSRLAGTADIDKYDYLQVY